MPVTQSRITAIIYRDEPISRVDARQGKHHAFYLFCVLKKIMEAAEIDFDGVHKTDAAVTGAHWQNFLDPVTGIQYELRITPLNQLPKAAT